LNVDSSESSRSQITYPSVDLSQITVKKPSVTQVTRLDIGIPQVAVTEFSPNQFAASPVDTAQVDIAKLSTFQADKLQFNPSQVGVLQNDSLKIPLSSSISSQQLFSIHALTPESITTINNIPQTLFLTVLTFKPHSTSTSFFTSILAKGQLAEAVVTKYDSLGYPISGTIEADPTTRSPNRRIHSYALPITS